MKYKGLPTINKKYMTIIIGIVIAVGIIYVGSYLRARQIVQIWKETQSTAAILKEIPENNLKPLFKTTFSPKYGLPFVWIVHIFTDPSVPIISGVENTTLEVSVFSSQEIKTLTPMILSKGVVYLSYGTNVDFSIAGISGVGTPVLFPDFSITRLSDAVIKNELGIYVQKPLRVFKVVSNVNKDQVSYIYWTSLQPLDGGKDFVIDGKVYVIKLNPIYESMNRNITEDDNLFQIDVSKKSISEIQAMQTVVHPFLCPNMAGFSFLYPLSKGWTLVNEGRAIDGIYENGECIIYFSWHESTKISAYVSVRKIYVDGLLDTQKMKVNPHGVHYVIAQQGGSWAGKKGLTDHYFGQTVDFYFVGKGVRVSLGSADSEEEPKPFDKETFFKSVIESFNITEPILKVGRTVNLLNSAGKVMNITFDSIDMPKTNNPGDNPGDRRMYHINLTTEGQSQKMTYDPYTSGQIVSKLGFDFKIVTSKDDPNELIVTVQ